MLGPLSTTKTIIRCSDCNNEATHECYICETILCKTCCPHPRWFRHLVLWIMARIPPWGRIKLQKLYERPSVE